MSRPIPPFPALLSLRAKNCDCRALSTRNREHRHVSRAMRGVRFTNSSMLTTQLRMRRRALCCSRRHRRSAHAFETMACEIWTQKQQHWLSVPGVHGSAHFEWTVTHADTGVSIVFECLLGTYAMWTESSVIEVRIRPFYKHRSLWRFCHKVSRRLGTRARRGLAG